MFVDIIQVKTNLYITARERGKKVPNLCRSVHNVWVNLGREFLPRAISPLDGTYTTPVTDALVQYIGLGIGGNRQLIDIATVYPTLDAHYPGLNVYDETLLTTEYLERPIKVTGTAGVGSSPGVWMSQVTAPPTFTGTPPTTVEFDTLFEDTDFHLSASYPSVPLSEIGLFLSSQVASLTSEQVYDYGASPYINTATRPVLIAYNTFNTISKTSSVSFEIRWKLQF